MFYEPKNNDHGLPYNPFKSIVIPRPIGWISTYGADRTPNVAPYSFFNGVGFHPPVVMFASSGYFPGQRMKDSVANAVESGVFVSNMVSYDLKDQMNVTAETTPPEIDEFEMAGLEMEPAKLVNAPMVKASPVKMECRTISVVDLPGHKPDEPTKVVFGEVIGIHIDDAYITEDGLIDVLKIRPVARLGYMDYTSVESVFTMQKDMKEEAIINKGFAA